MNSLSVISRAYDAEAPYILSFIKHYFKIGCADIHIVVPQGNPYSVLQDVIGSYPNVFLYTEHTESNMEGLRGSQSIPLEHVTSTHVISVDIDEYLDTDSVTPLLIHDYIRLNWVICPYLHYESEIIYGFKDRQCKYIVKKDICESLDDHNPTLNQKVDAVEADVKLLHYVYRSFNDLYLKCALSNYGDYQSTTAGQLNQIDKLKNLPTKFKMAALYKRIVSASSNDKFPKYYEINKELEFQLVSSTKHFDEMCKLQRALESYASRLDLKKVIHLMEIHPKYLEYGRMPHSEMSRLADLTLIDTLKPVKWFNQPKNTLFARVKQFVLRIVYSIIN